MDADFLKTVLEGNNVTILGLDPGETTGTALIVGPYVEGTAVESVGQIKGMTVPEAFVKIRQLIIDTKPDVVVMENYKVYSWKTRDHSWSDLFTARLIGAIECYCFDQNIKLVKQMAQQAKGFCTDDKLRAWGLWHEGQRHARDATRHAVYYLLFEVAQVHKLATPS